MHDIDTDRLPRLAWNRLTWRLRRDRARMWAGLTAQAAGFLLLVAAWGIDHELAAPSSFWLIATGSLLITMGGISTTVVLATLCDQLRISRSFCPGALTGTTDVDIARISKVVFARRLRRDRKIMWLSLAAQFVGVAGFVIAWGLDHEVSAPTSYRLVAISNLLVGGGVGLMAGAMSFMFDKVRIIEAFGVESLNGKELPDA